MTWGTRVSSVQFLSLYWEYYALLKNSVFVLGNLVLSFMIHREKYEFQKSLFQKTVCFSFTICLGEQKSHFVCNIFLCVFFRDTYLWPLNLLKKILSSFHIFLIFQDILSVWMLPGVYDSCWWPHIFVSFNFTRVFSTRVLANLLLVWTHTVIFITGIDPEHSWGAWDPLRKGYTYFQVWFKHHDLFSFQNFSSAQ